MGDVQKVNGFATITPISSRKGGTSVLNVDWSLAEAGKTFMWAHNRVAYAPYSDKQPWRSSCSVKAPSLSAMPWSLDNLISYPPTPDLPQDPRREERPGIRENICRQSNVGWSTRQKGLDWSHRTSSKWITPILRVEWGANRGSQSITHERSPKDAESLRLYAKAKLVTPLDELSKHVPQDLIKILKSWTCYDSGLNAVVIYSSSNHKEIRIEEHLFTKLDSLLRHAANLSLSKEGVYDGRLLKNASHKGFRS